MPRWGETGVLQVPTFTLCDEHIGELGRPNALSELKSKFEPMHVTACISSRTKGTITCRA
jgi:hypothetical protein